MMLDLHCWPRVRHIFFLLDVNWNVLQGWYIFAYSLERWILLYACRELVSSLIGQYGFSYLINPFIINPGYWQTSVEYILTRNASPLVRDDVKTNLMLANMKNDIFPLISAIIFPKVHIELMAVIHWNSWSALKCQRETSIDISRFYKITIVM